MSICETVQTQKWYYLYNVRSAYFPINRRLCRESVRERDRLCPAVKLKTQKQYYIHNMRSANFPINSRLHGERERLCPSVKW